MMAVTEATLPLTETRRTTHSGTGTGDQLRRLMRQVAQPVVVITGLDADRRPRGMTVSTFTSVSLDPPLVLFCADRSSRSWGALAPVGQFALNVLTDDQAGLAAAFARPGGELPAGVATDPDTAVPVLVEAAATAHCTVRDVHAHGDHDVVIAAVHRVRRGRAGHPLSYWCGGYVTARPLGEPSCPS